MMCCKKRRTLPVLLLIGTACVKGISKISYIYFLALSIFYCPMDQKSWVAILLVRLRLSEMNQWVWRGLDRHVPVQPIKILSALGLFLHIFFAFIPNAS